MLAFVLASLLIVPANSAQQESTARSDKPAIICREMGSAYSRSGAVVICRTRAEWNVRDTCQGATRYCSPEQKMAMIAELPGRPTPFSASEDSRIVCRNVSATGTRLRSTRTCMSNRDWQRIYDDTQSEMKDLQNTFSKKGPF